MPCSEKCANECNWLNTSAGVCNSFQNNFYMDQPMYYYTTNVVHFFFIITFITIFFVLNNIAD